MRRSIHTASPSFKPCSAAWVFNNKADSNEYFPCTFFSLGFTSNSFPSHASAIIQGNYKIIST